MNFIPEQPKSASFDVPYFDEVNSADGWQGHSTTKSIETLKSEVLSSIERLGGIVTGFQSGRFEIGEHNRPGFRVHYVLEAPDGQMIRGRIDVAALPIRSSYSIRKSEKRRREQSLKMALYMLRMALDGTYFLQQLSPGYAALMPWMLGSGEKTIAQLWSESAAMQNLLPQGEGDFVEGEVVQNDRD